MGVCLAYSWRKGTLSSGNSMMETMSSEQWQRAWLCMCTCGKLAPYSRRRQWHPTPVLLPGKSHGRRSLLGCAVHGVASSRTWLSNFTFTFHFHALEKEMATHSSVLAWRIPGTGEPCGLPSMGSHRVGHDWSDLAAAAAAPYCEEYRKNFFKQNFYNWGCYGHSGCQLCQRFYKS